MIAVPVLTALLVPQVVHILQLLVLLEPMPVQHRRVIHVMLSRMAHVLHVIRKVARRSHATAVVRTTMEWLQMGVKQSFVPLYQVDRALHVLQLKPVVAPQWFAMQAGVTWTIILRLDVK